MAVEVEEVPRWWTVDGVGHVLYSACACGKCEDALAAMCGLHGEPIGETGTAVPDRICSVCRRMLAAPTLKLGESRTAKTTRMEVVPVGTFKASEVPGVVAAIAAMTGGKPGGKPGGPAHN